MVAATAMPTYEYECQKCGHHFELYQSIKDGPKRSCPKCKKGRVKRLVGTGAGLLFKGSGFYITDYRKSGYKEAAKKDSPAASSPKSEPSTSKSESTSTSSSSTGSSGASESKPVAPKKTSPKE